MMQSSKGIELRKWRTVGICLFLATLYTLLTTNFVNAQQAPVVGLPALSVAEGQDGTQQYSLSLQLLALMSAITLLPSLLLGATAFTRIIIVLSILRQAMGTQQTPPNQVLVSIALFLTIFIMYPTLDNI